METAGRCRRFGKRIAVLVICGWLFGPAGGASAQDATHSGKRPVAVADIVGMMRVGEPLQVGYPGIGPKTGFASFSPDGKRFAVVVAKGNLKKNTNDYSLLLFGTGDVFRNAASRRLITFSSSSNEQGISNLSWLQDNETILFLGARGTQPAQLYSIRCDSGEVKRLTHHKTALQSFAESSAGRTIAYLASGAGQEINNAAVRRYGYNVSTDDLTDLIRGRTSAYETELYVKRSGVASPQRLRTLGALDTGINDLYLSPDGRHLVLKTDVREPEDSWRQYDDETIRSAFRRQVPKGSASGILRYELIDTRTGQDEVLLDSPAPFYSGDVLWAPDSKSILLCGVYLPLGREESLEREQRRSTKYTVEITLAGRRIAEISKRDLRPVRWDPETNIVQFHPRPAREQAAAAEDVYFRKRQGKWEQLSGGTATPERPLPDVRVEEDPNTSPTIVAIDVDTKRKATLVDLNPQFSTLLFARVETVRWPGPDGRLVSGGLYLPPGFAPGRRYPLVIQTHGFDPEAFWIDGPWSTAFAAQPLAGRGIAVLQVDDSFGDSINTPQEVKRAMGAYESAIEFLDEKGIVDRDRVGLMGFSRTCLHVKYALTHSSQRFAAALASDGFDGGYLEYLVAFPLAESEMESVAGAAPFGTGLRTWLENSPGFGLDRVRTPIQLQANAPQSLFEQWEWFAGLRRLNKPVDLVYLPAGVHILVRPWDRMVSEEKSVDWFCFWLKGEEDPNPAKAQQYAGWRELRRLQAEGER